jgi:hypothetical protein
VSRAEFCHVACFCARVTADHREAPRSAPGQTCHSLLLGNVFEDRGRVPSRPSGCERMRAAASRRGALTGGRDLDDRNRGNGRFPLSLVCCSSSPFCSPSPCFHSHLFMSQLWLHACWGPRFSECCDLTNGLKGPSAGAQSPELGESFNAWLSRWHLGELGSDP